MWNPYCDAPPDPSPEGAPARGQESHQKWALKEVPAKGKCGSRPEQGHGGSAHRGQPGAVPVLGSQAWGEAMTVAHGTAGSSQLCSLQSSP